MHTLVRRYLKTAILFLGAGLGLGGWMVVQRELFGRSPSPYLVSAHTHAVLVGFMMMMILGVALWMFPRPAKDDTRYRPLVAEVAYWLVSGGTALRLVGELARPRFEGSWIAWLVVASSAAQVLGIAAFFHNMWPRIRPLGSHVREAKGERF